MFTPRAGGERVDAVTHAVEAVTNAAQNVEKEEKKNQPESVNNEWVPPLAASTTMLNAMKQVDGHGLGEASLPDFRCTSA
jgi:hypothetical protein